MKLTTKPLDPISELRLRSGIPPDAGRLIRILYFLALAPMLYLRVKLGVRNVGVFRLFFFGLISTLWSLIVSYVVAGNDEDHQFLVFLSGMAFTFVMLGIGLCKRLARWYMRQRGEKLHTQSLGLSMLFRGVPGGNAERYLDPLLSAGGGLALCLIPGHPEWLVAGTWFAVGGIALYIVEKYLHELQLDQSDGLLGAEGHKIKTEAFLEAMTGTSKSAPPPPPVSTGLDPDLEESIVRRRNRRGQEPAPSLEASDAETTPAGTVHAPPAASRHHQEGTEGLRAPESRPAGERAQRDLFELTPPTPATRARTEPPTPLGGIAKAILSQGQGRARWVSPMAALGIFAGVGILATILTATPGRRGAAKPVPEPAPFAWATRTANATQTLVPVAAEAAPPVSITTSLGLPPPKLQSGAAAPPATAASSPLASPPQPMVEVAPGFKDSGFYNSLGDDFRLGRNGAEVNPERAVTWYLMAVRMGNADAQCSLGYMYLQGQGVGKRDEAKALKLFQEAAAQGHARAMGLLALMHESGMGGLPKNDVEALRWYRLAADAGNGFSAVRIGLIYEDGRPGIAKDEPQARRWYQRAAEAGNADGQSALADMLYNGRGGAKDLVAAAGLYRKAADQGSVRGQMLMGILHYNGEGGLEQSQAIALQWFRKAADQGDAIAETFVGLAYANGTGGVARDRAEAQRWFQKAADQGNEIAAKWLAALKN